MPNAALESDSSNSNVDDALLDELDESHRESLMTERIATEGVTDASSSSPIPIVAKVNSWIEAIKDRKTLSGNERRHRQYLEHKLKEIADHKHSEEYIWTQMVILDRIESAINILNLKCKLGETLKHIKGNREELAKKYGLTEEKVKKMNLKKCVETNKDIIQSSDNI